MSDEAPVLPDPTAVDERALTEALINPDELEAALRRAVEEMNTCKRATAKRWTTASDTHTGEAARQALRVSGYCALQSIATSFAVTLLANHLQDLSRADRIPIIMQVCKSALEKADQAGGPYGTVKDPNNLAGATAQGRG